MKPEKIPPPKPERNPSASKPINGVDGLRTATDHPISGTSKSAVE